MTRAETALQALLVGVGATETWHCDGMFVFGRPGAADLEKVRAEQVPLKVTYGEVGATRGALPAGYRHDRHVVDLGAGEDVYRRAVEGLKGWEAHRRAGLMLVPLRPPVQEGQTVVLAVSLPVSRPSPLVGSSTSSTRPTGSGLPTAPCQYTPNKERNRSLSSATPGERSASSSRPSRGHATRWRGSAPRSPVRSNPA